MGNITHLKKQNQHLQNQNTGLMQAIKRVRDASRVQAAESAEAIRQLTEITAAYIGAICLASGNDVQIKHEDIKRVLEGYDVLVENGEQGVTFSIVEKSE